MKIFEGTLILLWLRDILSSCYDVVASVTKTPLSPSRISVMIIFQNILFSLFRKKKILAKYYETIAVHWKYLNNLKIDFLRLYFTADIHLTRNLQCRLLAENKSDKEYFNTGF